MKTIRPGNLDIYFEELFKIVSFDPIDIHHQTDKVFGIRSEDIELDEEFAAIGYESAYFVTDMGSLLLFIILEIFLLFLSVLFWKCPCCFQKVRSYSGRRLDSFFFNSLLAFIDGTFLVLLLAATENIIYAIKGEVDVDTSFMFAVTLILLQLGSMIGLIYAFYTRFDNLDDKKNIDRFGYSYQDLNYKVRGWRALAYPIM